MKTHPQTETICMHYLIKGKVQGVWFRAHTQEKARSLNITGWVKNLTDGRVEVMACGSITALTALHAWLHTGPERAVVENVSTEQVAAQSFTIFEIK